MDPQPPSRRFKILGIILMILAVIIGVSVSAYFLLSQKKNNNIVSVQIPSKPITPFVSGSVQSISKNTLVIKDNQGKLNNINLSIPTVVWLSSVSGPSISSSSAAKKEQSNLTAPNAVTQTIKSDLSQLSIGMSVTVFMNKKDNKIISQEVLIIR